MILHVLPGDACVDTFRETGLKGEIAIFREALIDGDLSGDSLSEFWSTRERYLSSEHPENENSYPSDVVAEVEKILEPREGDEINLWFEYELFCSVNYWFCLDLLRESKAAVYRISPTFRDAESRWKGFGGLTPTEMLACYSERIKLSPEDLAQGSSLWQAFRSHDLENVRRLGNYDSPAFPHLKEVANAAGELDRRPKQILESIRSSGKTDFHDIFTEFNSQAGVYGFGDAQVKRLMGDSKPSR